MRIVDLSQDIYQGMMVYPGHSKTAMWQHATHVDSFSHLDPAEGAPSIDEMPLDLFYGPAVCLDVSHVEPRTDITAEHLRQANEASAAKVRRGDILLLHTADWNRHAGERKYLTEFPGLGPSGAEWIVS